jgi:hypothetical protein
VGTAVRVSPTWLVVYLTVAFRLKSFRERAKTAEGRKREMGVSSNLGFAPFASFRYLCSSRLTSTSMGLCTPCLELPLLFH